MWKSLLTDMYESMSGEVDSLQIGVVLGIHLFNISKGLQCTGLNEDDPESHDILPEAWRQNPQLFSFRYNYKSVKFYEKLLRVNQNKINIHAVRSDLNDKILHFSIDLSQITLNYQESNFIEILTESVLLPYEKEILSFVVGTKIEEDLKPIELEKRKSILEDESVPFGIPYNPQDFKFSNPFGSQFGIPSNLVGPGHPMFGKPFSGKKAKWDPPHPFFIPKPDGFNPYGPGFHYPHGFL